MADDDDGDDEIQVDPTIAVSGPRRATYTPPSASTQADDSDGVHDDDELANALAADLDRIASGPIPIIKPADYVPPEVVETTPETMVPEPLAPPAAPAWFSAPAPDPSQAVDLPDGPPQRPVRRSLPDDQLLNWVDEAGREPGGTLNVIEQLESQLRLREEEAQEFRAWENTMIALGTPDAADAVEDARPEFTGVLPSAPVPSAVATPPAPSPQPETGSFILPDSPVAEWPAPSFEDDAQDETPGDALADDDDDEPVEADRPVFEIPVIEPDAPAFEEPAPPQTLPSWDVPAPSATWSPGPDFGVEIEESEPEIVLEPEPEPEIVLEPEPDESEPLEPEPDEPAEPETLDRYPFAPPPLVEPPPFGGPPILPSEAASVPPFTPEAFDAIAADEITDAEVSEETTERSFDRRAGEATETDAAAEALFIEPLPAAAGENVPTDTGSVTVIDQAYEEELDDDVDEIDRVFDGLIGGPVSVDTAGIAVVGSHFFPPSGPIATARIPEDEVVLIDDEPVRQRVFSLEESGLEPTPVDHRVGRAARLFWLWFAANSSILSLGLGAAIFAVGMSLRQSIVAVLAGVALSFIPLGLSTLAGKRSGQPTMIVSRASFGLVGNVFPALLALVTRLFWGAVLLWLLASSVAIVLVGAELDGALGERQLLLISLAVAFLVALLVAFAGYPLVARMQLILSVISGALVIGLITMTAHFVNIPIALSTQDGPWVLTITGAVLVFSFVGLVWANSGADLARYQRVGSSGASSMLWATFGTTLPTFVLIGYGALLAASNEGIASGFLQSPLDTLALMLPSWYPIPLLAATALSLLSGIILTLYSGGFALQSVGVRLPRQWSIVIVGVLLGGLALLLTFGVTGGINELFRDLATTLAVPTAAWAGIFAAETMIRNRRFESQSLLTRGGVYPDVRWANLIGLFLISAVGFALTTATVTWLSWQGYGFTLLGFPLDSDLAGTDLGVLVALVLGLLTPILTGIPTIRRQEAAIV